ncbi:hypothetical protein [Pantoea ananatis]|nr:hypothetical protein [Pantoea ananatis]
MEQNSGQDDTCGIACPVDNDSADEAEEIPQQDLTKTRYPALTA